MHCTTSRSRSRRAGRRPALAIAAGLLGLAPLAAAAPSVTPELTFQARVNARFNVTASHVVHLDLDTTPGRSLSVAVPIEGRAETIEFAPHSVRHPDYEVLMDAGNGRLMPVDPQPVRTIRGHVAGDDQSIVAGAMMPNGLSATVLFADGRRYWIEPLAGAVDDAGVGAHVVYANRDVLPADGGCGNVEFGHAEAAPEPAPEAPEDLGGIFCAQFACDADFEYFQDYGSVGAVENRINLVTSTMNVQYETQTGITHAITTIIVRTSPADPYVSVLSGTLLCEFITEWTNNQQSVQFDVAKLFTGKEIFGGTIGQAANFGEICDRQGCCGCGTFGFDDGAFCHSQSDCCGGLACATDLMAHELGHLWSAVHCNPCSATMRSFIGCFNSFTPQSINSIVSVRNSVACLDLGECTGLPQLGACCVGMTCMPDTSPDACDAAGGIFQGDGTTCAGGACMTPVGGCCVGCLCTPMTAADCAAINGGYAGDGVPCSQEFCPCGACCLPDETCVGGIPSLNCLAVSGTFQGIGSTCAPELCAAPDCPGDVDGSGDVGFGDILQVIGAWGPCPGCPEDVDGSGDVGFGDILQVIGMWGPCA